jgi:LuxR family maltose regulon positive regulatory protein
MVLFVQGFEERTLARLHIAQGHFGQAIRLLTPLRERLEDAGWMGVVLETLVLEALALQGQGRTAEAFAALRRALSLAEPEGYVRVFVDGGPPMAELLATIKGQWPALDARLSAGDALRAYVDRLLYAFERERWPTADVTVAGAPHPAPDLAPATLPEPLTDREVEVLRLLVAGLSNREIAERLTITVGTAKRHVSNIYAKLGVHSRVQAVTRARSLHLV